MSFTEKPARVGVPVLVGVVLVSTLLAALAVTGNVGPRRISVVTSLLLIVVTATYAYLTYGLLLESRESRRRESAPVLTVVTEEYGVVPELLNVGNGPAREVEVTLHAVRASGETETTRLSIRNLGIDQSYPILEDPFGKLTDEEATASDEFTELRVTGTLRDAFDDEVSVDLRYELSEIGPAPDIARGPTASALEDIAVELGRLRESRE
ncbi:hypothetical protein RYH80_07375 [Halobaculum sp. MBLA0147]|uniref:hypothetical protein n=1 Tax=Halobaculum sp. MBLA0147 TaxID=3079934 RepID=UPI003524A8F3